jgi:hypothetical protein
MKYFTITTVIKNIIVLFQYWNLLALDGSNWQRVDLFDFQVDVKVCKILQ